MLEEMLQNQAFVMGAMAVIVLILTQILKMPIKAFTKHIQNEVVRKRVNAIILLIPFAVGVALDFVYSTYYMHELPTVLAGLNYGFWGISLYNIVAQFFDVKSEYQTEQGKEAIELVKKVALDGKVDEKDSPALKAFLDKVK